MTISMLFFLALGLSMDAFAVSISNAMCYKNMNSRQATLNAACFGIFQGLMPVVGYFAGRVFEGFITAIDHWVALILLGIIGGKMLVEGIKALREPDSCPQGNVFTTKTMLVQAVATSIDALAVGISLAALEVNIWSSAGLIALLTFVVCLFGALLGKKFGMILGDWAEILGGGILVFIGIKIFVEHMGWIG